MKVVTDLILLLFRLGYMILILHVPYTMKAVSYTHLDVYKRQQLHHVDALVAYEIENYQTDKAMGDKSKLPSDYLVAVSYTHLAATYTFDNRPPKPYLLQELFSTYLSLK